MARSSDTPRAAEAPACPWEAVLWDFDGTLADTARDVWDSLDYAARCLGARLSDDLERSGENLSLPMGELFSRLVPPVDRERLADFDADVALHYRALSAHEHTELFPGVRELVSDLRGRGVPCRIVTNKPRAALERLLALKGWEGLFDGWVCPDSDGSGTLTKAQMIGLALGEEGVAAERAVMVGDSAGDVEGAREAGAASAAVTYGDGNVERLLGARPDHVARDAGELREILLRG